ncbi:MAG: hypothetical protein QXO69_02055 [archaeon]
MPQRATALKVFLKTVINAPYHAGASIDDPNYIEVNGEKAARVSVVGKVTEKAGMDASNYSSLTLEQGGVRLRARFFGKETSVNEGDLAKVIGKTRESNGERFILGEIAKKISGQELRLHELESQELETKDSCSFVQDAGSV